jgi:hypothetical protein
MPKNIKDHPNALQDQIPPQLPDIVELDEHALVAVAGGLNPQPLPPGVVRLDE